MSKGKMIDDTPVPATTKGKRIDSADIPAFRPLLDRVVVRRDPAEEVSAGGIVLPEGTQEKPQQGTALLVGPGRWEKGELIPPTVKPGDRILFGKWAGNEASSLGDDILIMHESDILGICE